MEVEIIDDVVLGAKETRTVSNLFFVSCSAFADTVLLDTHLDQMRTACVPCRHPCNVRIPVSSSRDGVFSH